ncbi:hypothetical protein O3P69_015848 [Scylla paramamosain]|uniref:Reverse transcriptase n=1 Tax=Scylla paramamosain TaxID=85552 RepID=A0AAW0T8J3_SCYPA
MTPGRPLTSPLPRPTLGHPGMTEKEGRGTTTKHLTVLQQNIHGLKMRQTVENVRERIIYAREQINIIREERWLWHVGHLTHTTNMTQMWQHVNRVRGKHTHPPAYPNSAGKAGQLITDYRDRSASVRLTEQLRCRKAELHPTRWVTITAETLLHDDTDHEILRDELLRAWKTSKDTVPGDNDITYSMLSHVCNMVGDPLLCLFSRSLMQSMVHKEWKAANIIPIPNAQ